jgi:broad specificity phosphatase PhoE
MRANFSLPLFYFLRHGVTDHNLRRLIMGQLDVPLNDLGRQQARAVIPFVRPLGLRAILSSPLSRARETAGIVAAALGLEVTAVDGFRERDWGELTGHPYRELIRDVPPPSAERADAFTARVLAGAGGLPSAGPALIVAHSGVCRVLRRHFRLDNVEAPVPNAVLLMFAPRTDGGWRETVVANPVPSPG